MKRALASISLVAALSALGVLAPRDAEACGGCFVPPGPSTQVTAHRMAFALSAKRTVLWDQIQYVGAPSEFGWVLPIKTKVDVGVSSDQLFQRLEQSTQPQINPPPPPQCPEPEKRCRTSCNRSDNSPSGGFADASTASDTGSVDVWSQSVVGPYEATQLSATDGTALRNWLTDHGYVIPDSIGPVIDQYIAEGSGFLAIKLVPEATATRMVPIRIGFDGSSPSLPLRMIAAGSGAKVGIKLFVLGEGRWESKNFVPEEVKTADLIWDWRAMASNYGTLEIAAIAKHAGATFVTETSDDVTKVQLVANLPPGTTTTEAGTVFSSITDQTELDAAFPTRTSIRLTRLFAELPQTSLGKDLELQASLGGPIPRARMAPKGINYACQESIEVDCPGISPVCDGQPPGGSVDGGLADGGVEDDDASTPFDPNLASTSSSGGGFGCNTAGGPLGGLGGFFVVSAAAMTVSLRRRLSRVRLGRGKKES